MFYFLRKYPGNNPYYNRRNLFYDFEFSASGEVVGEGYFRNPYSFLYSMIAIGIGNNYPGPTDPLYDKINNASWAIYKNVNNTIFQSTEFATNKSKLSFSNSVSIPDSAFWSGSTIADDRYWNIAFTNPNSVTNILNRRYLDPLPIDYDTLTIDTSRLKNEHCIGNMNYGFFMVFRILSALTHGELEQKGYEESSYSTLFMGRREVKKVSKNYHIRIESDEFNFSNNASYVKDSSGNFKHIDFTREPKSYITTIGLYNENYELLVVGKLPRPIEKKFGKEYIINIRLEY